MNSESFINQSFSGSLLQTEKEYDVLHEEKRKITITLQAYQQIETFFPICDIQTQFIYNNEDIGSSPPIPITDNEVLPIDYSFHFIVDIASTEQLDKLISSPGLLKVILTPGAFDREIYEQLVLNPEFTSTKPKSLESVISVYEAFNEDKRESVLPESRRSTRKSILKKEKAKVDRTKRDKSMSEGKNMRISSVSNKSETNMYLKPVDHESQLIKRTILYGQSTIDFIPFFYGKTSFEETLLIKQFQELDDDCMKPFKHYPKILISVSIDQPLTIKHSLLMHFSLESVYNFPHSDDPDLEVQVCWVLPKSDDSYSSPIIFNNPIQTYKKATKRPQFWPNMKKDATNCTKYWVNDTTDEIKCRSIGDIGIYFQDGIFRLEFNVIKRNIFFQDGKISIQQMFKDFKHILMEIEIVSKSKKKSTSETQMLPTHFMAIVDVSGLLYPGARKTRVAAPLKTFCLDEAKETCGLQNSYFRPEEIQDHQSVISFTRGQNQDRKNQRQRSVRSSRKSLKNESIAFEGNNINKKSFVQETDNRLFETSAAVYNEIGKPCFIVVDIELSEAINGIREIEDLSNKLKEILKMKVDQKDKLVITATVAEDYYTVVLNEIIADLNKKFIRFIKENPKYNKKSDTLIGADFVKFLQKTGAYKLYLSSISKAISIVATTEAKFKNFSETNPESSTQDFIGELFCYLISKMHDTVNGLICHSSQLAQESNSDNLKELFFYAKEATELGLTELANRYFLERLSFDENNSDYWFDYSVFFLELNDIDGALECIRKALLLQPNHRYSLISFGIIMVIKSQIEEAETALLFLVANESKWVEGWGVLYIFYQAANDSVGMGWAKEMAKKNLHITNADHYFAKYEDLAWSTKQYPNRIFLRTAVLLIKMRLFDWAEIACSQELHANTEFVKELLAAMCFYRKKFHFAESYLLQLKSGNSWNDTLTALSGHCLLGLDKKEDAKDEYYSILKSENCSTNLHLVYIKCAKIVEDLGDTQEARKLILLACKHAPTPYTWLRAGQLYYLQHDFLSAEECLTVANSLDNRNADIWGYLTLINLKMLRFNEAELCYNQAVKRDMPDRDLLSHIEAERTKHNLN